MCNCIEKIKNKIVEQTGDEFPDMLTYFVFDKKGNLSERVPFIKDLRKISCMNKEHTK